MSSPGRTLPPIRRQIVVPTDPGTAFTVWTEEIETWWPLHRHSVFGAESSVSFTGGRLVERGPDGTESVWGEILDWSPPDRLRITWHPGHGPDPATEVEVRFERVDDATGAAATLVTLTHHGWERLPDPTGARAEYERGWPTVVGQFGRRTAQLRAEPVWLALLHTPGPKAPTEGSIFQHEDFPEHLRFVSRLDDDGVLLAAGPLGDGTGTVSGMCVLRVPDDAAAAEYARLAAEEDQSVVRGLLRVEARPWRVVVGGS
jgi:uncharacterized protein YndB with AHSA1/START domain/uncharacterized protein YciI